MIASIKLMILPNFNIHRISFNISPNYTSSANASRHLHTLQLAIYTIKMPGKPLPIHNTANQHSQPGTKQLYAEIVGESFFFCLFLFQ